MLKYILSLQFNSFETEMQLKTNVCLRRTIVLILSKAII